MSTSEKIVFGVKVDINDYYDKNKQPKHKPFKQHKGKFSHFGWYNISGFKGNLHADVLDNLGIRLTQDLEREQDDFNHHLQREGWDINYFPPIISLNDDLIMNGRKRIRAGVKEGEKYIPVAYYTYPLETTKGQGKRNTITNGLKANIPSDHGQPTKYADVYNAAVVLHKLDQLNPQDDNAVHSWLYDELEIEDALSPTSIMRLKNKISNIINGGSAFMHMMDRPQALDYLKKSEKVQNLGGVSENEDDASKVALYSPSQVNAFRFFGQHLLPNAKLGKQTNLVLYTTKADSAICSENIQYFISLLSQLQKNACALVMKEMGTIGENYDSSSFESSLVNVLGAIPQKKIGGNAEEHQTLWNINDLISIENYGD